MVIFFHSWFAISDPKNSQIPSFMQSKLYFAILVHHIGSAILNIWTLTPDPKLTIQKSPRFWVSCKSSYILRFQSAILDLPFLIFKVWPLIRNQRLRKSQDTEFHASQIEFCNFDPPSWISGNFKIWLHICITTL